MRQVYFCPNCRALIARSDRFCSNCGIHVNWVVLQTPPRSSLESYGYQYPDRQQTLERRLTLYDKQPGYGQRPNMSNKVDNIPHKNSSSVDGTETSIRTDIIKLLAASLYKQVKDN